jgi:glycosyltransferase involved in cell wall biosynthesis
VRPHLAPPAGGEVRPGAVPTFSVIVAAYQAEASIAEAVDSALAQTRPPLEVIVCDDGSTDDLEAALARFRGRVVYLRRPHGGVASARNSALALARGEFVAILDADDVFLPERLDAMRELAVQRPDLDILSTDEYFEADGEIVGRFYDHNPFPVMGQDVAIFEGCWIGGHPAVRRSRLLDIGGFDESLGRAEDWDCWIRLLTTGSQAGLVEEPLLRYHLHEDSLTAERAESLRARVIVLEKHAASSALDARYRSAITASLRRHGKRALVAEATAALLGPGSTRARLFDIARRRGTPWSARAKIVPAVIWPATARAWLRRRRAPSPLTTPADRFRARVGS